MPTRSQVLGNGTIRGENALGVSWEFQPLHPSLPLPGRLGGMLGAVIKRAVLTGLHPREALPLCRTVAFQLIGDEPPWDILTPFEELTENLLRGRLLPSALHQTIEHGPVLLHGSPEIGALLGASDAHVIQRPLLTRSRPPAPQLSGIRLAEFPTLLANRFVGDEDTADEQEFVPITMA